MPIDRKWIESKVEALGYTNRHVAAKLDVHASALSRMLRGDQAWSLDNAVLLAKTLNVSLGEVAAHLGYSAKEYADVVGTQRQTPIATAAAAAAEAEVLERRLEQPFKADLVLRNANGDTVEIECKAVAKIVGAITDSGEISMFREPKDTPAPSGGLIAFRYQSHGHHDGATYFAAAETSIAECLNRLSIVELAGTQVARIVRRGADRAAYDLVSMADPNDRIHDVPLSAGRPVEWVRL